MASNTSEFDDVTVAISGFDDAAGNPTDSVNYYQPQFDRLSLLSYSSGTAVLLSAGYMIIFILAVVSNGAVIAVIWRSPAMRNVTSYLLANLAAADIAVAVFVMPITLLSTLFTGTRLSTIVTSPQIVFHSGSYSTPVCRGKWRMNPVTRFQLRQ